MAVAFSLERVQDLSITWPLPDGTLYTESDPIGLYVRILDYIRKELLEKGASELSEEWLNAIRRYFHWPDSHSTKVQADPKNLLPAQNVIEWYGKLRELVEKSDAIKKATGDFSTAAK